MVAFYPALGDMSEFRDLFDQYPKAFLSFFGIDDVDVFLTASGFIHGELYSAMLPIIFLVFTILRGAEATAGEEQDGTMDLTLSVPVSRDRVVVDRFLSMAALTGGLGFSMAAVLLVGNVTADMGLSVAGVVSINLALVLMSLLFGALAMAVGAWSGRRVLASGVAAGVAAAAFFVNGLAPLVDGLEIPQKLSPFYWLLGSKPLANGFAWSDLGWLTIATAALFGLAVWAFRHRDIST